MSTVFAWGKEGPSYVIGLLALVLPFRVGLLNGRFWRALLAGWGLWVLAFVLREALDPIADDPWRKPFHAIVMLMIFGGITGWLPASAAYLAGRLIRRGLKLRTASLGWGRFTAVIALLVVVLWWPGVRIGYFVKVYTGILLQVRQRDAEFANLSRVLPPLDATLVRVYRGLPHHSYATGKLWHDLFATRNRAMAGFRFHAEPMELPTDLQGDLSRAMQDPGLYRRYLGPKLCGGYHPDYCFEWESPQGRFLALLCLGCHEVRLAGPEVTVHCEMRVEPGEAFCKMVDRLQTLK